jgi:hypothetical protein
MIRVQAGETTITLIPIVSQLLYDRAGFNKKAILTDGFFYGPLPE